MFPAVSPPNPLIIPIGHKKTTPKIHREKGYMTTEKQASASKENAKKSTGAKSAEGKAIIASNALKHGLFTRHLVIEGEQVEDYHSLLGGLMTSLSPVGTLESLLVEKIASAIWKQKRLISAEQASIELSRSLKVASNKSLVHKYIGANWDESIEDNDLAPEKESDLEAIARNCKVIDEYHDLLDELLDSSDLKRLSEDAPLIYQHLLEELEAEEYETAELYFKDTQSNLRDWAGDLYDYCEKDNKRYQRKSQVQAVAELVKASLTAPINNELIGRYQTAIDNELYKAVEALRKQQEWRIKAVVVDMAYTERC